MLEAVHLTKVYKSKKNATTKALDDVSIRFPQTGMVFLLGKSGSGKSTLLNVCGGLDNPTSGEIIINGRSSKNFTQSDFDSYRNTLVGFVFQEYNILNEFSVETNISIALELQGKSKDKKVIKQLLKDVDLEDYGHRKPNTLSGGQKQRIAIARALIKDPKIIMADEPTGALDSATGKQVFDTLKKLSSDKLVIVVSHDREFAEKYADRIIELKDGKIISDLTKSTAKATAVGENIDLISKGTISIKNAEELTEKDYEYLHSFLSKNKQVLISAEEKDISDFKQANHITQDNHKEYFSATDETAIPKPENDNKAFIRSKLPLKHAFKLGASSLKTKPVKLFFTIFICSMALIMFGLSSTMLFFNEDSVTYKTVIDSNTQILKVEKEYKYWYNNGNGGYYSERTTNMNENDIDKLSKSFGNNVFGAIYESYCKDYSIHESNYTINQLKYQRGFSDGYYYILLTEFNNYDINNYDINNYDMFSFSYLPENHSFRSQAVMGKYPEKANEIWISSYFADVLVNFGWEGANTQSKLLGKNVCFSSGYYTISGIFDGGGKQFSEKYDKFKNISGYISEDTTEELKTIQNELIAGYHCCLFLSENDFNNLAQQTSNNERIRYDEESVYSTTKYVLPEDNRYTCAFVPATNNRIAFNTLTSKFSKNDSRFRINNDFMSYINSAVSLKEECTKIFLIIGCVLALFSTILLSNYIATSISYKTKEIGILRAIGARSSDVFRIFYSESFIISIICTIVSSVGCLFICKWLNSEISSYFTVSLFVFDALPFLSVLVIAILGSVIGTILPVKNATRKKPVDAIRSL